MITYTTGDKWLKQKGTLVFVITQTHFQSPSSQGFRSFKIDPKANLIPEAVDDLKLLKPFPKVANKTAIVRMRKVGPKKQANYPVAYTVWEKNAGTSATIPEAETKAGVYARITRKAWEATPVSGGNSPWAILPPGRFAAMTKIQGKSDWAAGRKGVTADLNGVYMVEIVNTNSRTGLVQILTRPDAGRIDIGPARKFWVEPALLYPLLKGAGDFTACHVHLKKELYIFVPNSGILVRDYVAAVGALKKLPETAKYFKHYKSLLERRSTYRLRQKDTAPYYAIYNTGAYTFAPYKVVWAELSTTFQAAVFENGYVPLVGSRPIVPDHKVYFSDFSNRDEAYYVCAILNASIIKEYIESHTIQIQVSNIFKHLSIPRYKKSDKDHCALASLCDRAHSAKTQNARDALLKQMNVIAERILT
jgi:predicted lipoprotein